MLSPTASLRRVRAGLFLYKLASCQYGGGSVQSTTQASGYSRRDETISQRTGLGTQHPEAGGFTPRSGGPGYQDGSQRSLSSW